MNMLILLCMPMVGEDRSRSSIAVTSSMRLIDITCGEEKSNYSGISTIDYEISNPLLTQ